MHKNFLLNLLAILASTLGAAHILSDTSYVNNPSAIAALGCLFFAVYFACAWYYDRCSKQTTESAAGIVCIQLRVEQEDEDPEPKGELEVKVDGGVGDVRRVIKQEPEAEVPEFKVERTGTLDYADLVKSARAPKVLEGEQLGKFIQDVKDTLVRESLENIKHGKPDASPLFEGVEGEDIARTLYDGDLLRSMFKDVRNRIVAEFDEGKEPDLFFGVHLFERRHVIQIWVSSRPKDFLDNGYISVTEIGSGADGLRDIDSLTIGRKPDGYKGDVLDLPFRGKQHH